MGKKRALIVGINEYEDKGFEKLKYAESDAKAIYDVLVNPDIGDFRKDDVSLLTEESKSKLEESLEEILHKSQRDDLVFIYFAGHGKLDRSGRLCLAARNTKTEKLLATSIHLEHVRRMIDDSDCKRVVFIIDSCFSGAAGQSFRSGDVPTESLEQISGQGKVIISASQAFERARERDDIGHGVFTYNLVKGLKEGEADHDDDGYISIEELYRYISKKVKAETGGQQVPMKWGMDEKGEIIIAKSIKTLEKKRAEIERLCRSAGELENQGRLDEALNLWKKVLEIDFKNTEAPVAVERIVGEKKKRAELEAKIDKLFDFYQKGIIPAMIYNRAFGIIRNPKYTTGDKKEETFARLVEDLLSSHLTPENFVLSWNRIEKVEAQSEIEVIKPEERKAQNEMNQEESAAEAGRLEQERQEREEQERTAREKAERIAHVEELKKKTGKNNVRRTSPWVYGTVGGLIVTVLLAIVVTLKWNDSQQRPIESPTTDIENDVTNQGRGNKILYKDNFATIDPAWGETNANLSVNNGRLIIQPGANMRYVAINQANLFENMNAHVKVRLAKSDDPSWAGGFVFWAQDYNNYYTLSVNGNGWFRVERRVNGRELAPVAWRENGAVKKGVGEWNDLRLKINANHATVYINNKEVVTFKGQPPQGGGMIGVFGDSPSNTTNTWEFSDLEIWEP